MVIGCLSQQIRLSQGEKSSLQIAAKDEPVHEPFTGLQPTNIYIYIFQDLTNRPSEHTPR